MQQPLEDLLLLGTELPGIRQLPAIGRERLDQGAGCRVLREEEAAAEGAIWKGAAAEDGSNASGAW